RPPSTSSAVLLSFFSRDPAASDIYTLSLHDALPICFETYEEAFAEVDRFIRFYNTERIHGSLHDLPPKEYAKLAALGQVPEQKIDRKSTRLNSSHVKISYAVFCLKKKKKKIKTSIKK